MDTEITVFLLAALLAVSLALRPSRPSRLWLLGAVWGLGLAVRPYFACMALPIAYALWITYGRAALKWGALVAACAFATLAAATVAAHGSLYFPQNGPYNFFAGANSHTQFALLHAYNAEPSIAPAMADHGYPATAFYNLSLRPVYTRLALTYIAAHPLQWIWLGLVKLATLLRPDTKAHALWTGTGFLKLLTSLSAPVWLILLASARSFRKTDRLFVLFAIAYVLPFLLTNADPRFRPALDVLLLTHAAVLLARRAAPSLAKMRAGYGRGAKYPVLERT